MVLIGLVPPGAYTSTYPDPVPWGFRSATYRLELEAGRLATLLVCKAAGITPETWPAPEEAVPPAQADNTAADKVTVNGIGKWRNTQQSPLEVKLVAMVSESAAFV
jgi:hypothetical protein